MLLWELQPEMTLLWGDWPEPPGPPPLGCHPAPPQTVLPLEEASLPPVCSHLNYEEERKGCALFLYGHQCPAQGFLK